METKNVTVVFDRKKRSAKTGKGKVEIVIYFRHNTRKYIVVGDATPSDWKVVADSKRVRERMEQCTGILDAMQAMGEELTPENFNVHYENFDSAAKLKNRKDMYNGVDQNQSFVDYMKICIANEELSDGTRKHKECVVRFVQESGLLDRFKDLTTPNIIAFDEYLHKTSNRTDNTIYGYHKKVHIYVAKLFIAGKIPYDPYKRVKFNPGSNKERRPLSEDELLQIRNIKLPEKLDRVRDLFIFSAYTGLAYIDAMVFQFDLMTEKVGDMYYIDGSRVKTGSAFFTPILKPAMDVLKKYDYKLPHLSNQKANDYLHIIESRVGLNKPMTFHVARHSFATLALAHDIPIENVARMLGHTSVKTTQIYAKVLKTTIERHASKLNDDIK